MAQLAAVSWQSSKVLGDLDQEKVSEKRGGDGGGEQRLSFITFYLATDVAADTLVCEAFVS